MMKLDERIEQIRATLDGASVVTEGYNELRMWTQRVGGYLKKKHIQTLQRFLKDAISLRKQDDLDEKELAVAKKVFGTLIKAYESALADWNKEF